MIEMTIKHRPRDYTEKPLAQIGDVALLRVTSLQKIGTFLNWGKEKELFLPFSEQTRRLNLGESVVVYIYVDNNQRSCASMRVEKFLDKTAGDLKVRDRVQLFIMAQTDLGFKAVINRQHLGILYRNEIFKPVRIGQRLTGYIRHLRLDGKIDLTLQQAGHQDVEAMGTAVLVLLESRGGFLPVGDHTSAEVIYDLFGISKKKFKMTIGGLYKRRRISIEKNGIKLTSAFKKPGQQSSPADHQNVSTTGRGAFSNSPS